jgi:WD repeat-containing protein 22
MCLCASLALFLSSETLDVFAHEDAVYGLSVSPVNDNIFASSSDDGRVLIWDIRESPHGGRVTVGLC